MTTKLSITATMATAIVAIGSSTVVYAQDKQSDLTVRLRVCAALTGMTEQLECFNGIVESLEQSPAAAVVGSSSAMVATADAPDVDTQTVAVTASTVTTAAAVSGQEPAAPAPSSPATVNTAEPVTTAVTAENSFGVVSMKTKAAPKKVAPKKEEPKTAEIQSIRATIVSAWVTSDKRFEARLDNGQVWRETARTRRNRLPKEGSTVVISKGAFGSYKMKFGNDNRQSAVRRTQ